MIFSFDLPINRSILRIPPSPLKLLQVLRVVMMRWSASALLPRLMWELPAPQRYIAKTRLYSKGGRTELLSDFWPRNSRRLQRFDVAVTKWFTLSVMIYNLYSTSSIRFDSIPTRALIRFEMNLIRNYLFPMDQNPMTPNDSPLILYSYI